MMLPTRGAPLIDGVEDARVVTEPANSRLASLAELSPKLTSDEPFKKFVSLARSAGLYIRSHRSAAGLAFVGRGL